MWQQAILLAHCLLKIWLMGLRWWSFSTIVRIVVALLSLSCQTLYDPMDCSTPDYPVPQYLPELVQTYIHWVSDALQPSHPLLSPFPPTFNISPQQGFFQWVISLHQVGQGIGASASALVLPVNTQDWSPLGWTGWISLQSKGLSRVSSNTTVQKHQFFSAQPPLWMNSHIHTWLLEKP